MTVYPIEMMTTLWIKDKPRDWDHARIVMLRWLERGAARAGRFVNVPSLVIETEHDISQRKTFLRAYLYTVPEGSPDILRTIKVPSVNTYPLGKGGLG